MATVNLTKTLDNSMINPKAVRMLTLQKCTSVIEGILTKTVEFTKGDGQHVVIPAGKQVTVDTGRNIALFGNDHFQIEDDEYVPAVEN